MRVAEIFSLGGHWGGGHYGYGGYGGHYGGHYSRGGYGHRSSGSLISIRIGGGRGRY
jgi:hypothetical protein